MYKYATQVGDDLVSAEQLNEKDNEGWELVQIVPYVEGTKNMKPGQYVYYFRRLEASS